MSDTNPIATRIDQLQDQWVTFADSPKARLLVWRATRDEAALVDAFVARECEGEAAETPDLFVQLAAPFAHDAGHGFALASELSAQYAEAAVSFDDDERASRWSCPQPNDRDGAVGGLLAILLSFRTHHVGDGSDAILAVCLVPSEVSSTDSYALWLQRLVREAPSELRFVIVEDTELSRLTPLIEAEPTRVLSVACALNMAPVLAELSDRGGAHTAGDELRRLQTELGQLIGGGNLSAALPVAIAAVGLTVAQGWPHLAAAVQMALAAGYSAQQRHAEALDAYRDAARLAALYEIDETRSAVEAEQDHEDVEPAEAKAQASEGAPTFGKQLHLQALLGCASVMLSARSYKPAGETYLEAAVLANVIADARCELDCYRLASVCYGEHGDRDRAWELGMHGFQLGLSMDEETRRTSTLPYLAEHLVRLTKTKSGHDARRKPLEEHFVRVLGADWRAQLASAAGA